MYAAPPPLAATAALVRQVLVDQGFRLPTLHVAMADAVGPYVNPGGLAFPGGRVYIQTGWAPYSTDPSLVYLLTHEALHQSQGGCARQYGKLHRLQLRACEQAVDSVAWDVLPSVYTRLGVDLAYIPQIEPGSGYPSLVRAERRVLITPAQRRRWLLRSPYRRTPLVWKTSRP